MLLWSKHRICATLLVSVMVIAVTTMSQPMACAHSLQYCDTDRGAAGSTDAGGVRLTLERVSELVTTLRNLPSDTMLTGGSSWSGDQAMLRRVRWAGVGIMLLGLGGTIGGVLHARSEARAAHRLAARLAEPAGALANRRCAPTRRPMLAWDAKRPGPWLSLPR